MKNIVVTTDFSKLARSAYPVACSLAADFESTVHLVHEAEALPPLYYESATPDFPIDSHYEGLKAKLEEELRHPALNDTELTPHLLYDGAKYQKLVDFSRGERIDLIVMSTHGYTGLAHALLGSFAERVARHSSVPVLTYRGSESESTRFVPRSVLVPFDFSENARAIFPIVRLLGKQYGTKITLFHVLSDEFVHGYGEFYEECLKESKNVKTAATEKLQNVCTGELGELDAAIETSLGNPYLEIVESAERTCADLIVMATHGWTGLRRFLLGSVAEKILRRAPCSVLTVRPEHVEERRQTDRTR